VTYDLDFIMLNHYKQLIRLLVLAFLVTITDFNFLSVSAVQNADGQQQDRAFPGRSVPLRDAALQCKDAMVARLIDLGTAEPGPPGATDYDKSKWEIIETLKGKYAGEVELDLTVQKLPNRIRESQPQVGETYIVLSYPNNAFQIRKVIEYTPENLNKIKALISQRRQSNNSFNRSANSVNCPKHASTKLCTFGARLSVATHL
jgi:hypothetical protein